MNDLWYTFGAMVVDPSLLSKIEATKPRFKKINMQVTVNGDSTERPAAGYLTGPSTTAVRKAIRDYFSNAYPASQIVISLYTAGKLCQLLGTDKKRLQTAIRDAHTALKQPSACQSPGVLTIIGAAILDNALANALTIPSSATALVKEFRLSPVETTMLTAWLAHPKFLSAQKMLLGARCWAHVCSDVFFFYAKFEGAVN